jgi:hypothetical protein
MPIPILRITRSGKKKSDAIIFGRIRKDAEFTPIISRASICSLTLILPISEAMLEPTLPASIKEIIVGENSKIRESLLANPIKYLGRSGF